MDKELVKIVFETISPDPISRAVNEDVKMLFETNSPAPITREDKEEAKILSDVMLLLSMFNTVKLVVNIWSVIMDCEETFIVDAVIVPETFKEPFIFKSLSISSKY